MKCITVVTLGKLIEAHMEHDEEKFLSYANFIAEACEEVGEIRKAGFIRSKIDGTHRNQPQVSLDSSNVRSSWRDDLMNRFTRVV